MSSRLKRLEAQPGLRPHCALRWGVLKRLPEDYVGERHVGVLVAEVDLTAAAGLLAPRCKYWGSDDCPTAARALL
jgi:hypothetical protein